ncbi:MAG: hypothetical protein AAF531_21225, partial [Actinomycetota bacterium]
AIGLPVVGLAGALAQAFTPAAPTVQAVDGQELVLLAAPSAASPATTAPSTTANVEDPIDPMRGWSESDRDGYAAFWTAGYNYQQLLALAEEWNLSEFEAKARAGAAILAGDTSSFDDIVVGIAPAPEEIWAPDPVENTLPFWDAGYGYEDAVALAEAWNLDIWDAKVQAAELIEDGRQTTVDDVLAAA